MRTHRRIRMRILFLALDINLDRQRGDTVHAMELANGLASIGHAITFVVGAASGHSPTLRSDIVLRVVGGSNRRVVRETLAIAKRSAIDIVYERRSTPKIGFAVKTRRRIPLVMEINGILRDELHFQGRADGRTVRGLLKDRLRGALFRRVDGFIVVSEGIKDDLVARHGVDPRRVLVVGNAVNTTRFQPIAKQSACRRLELESERPRAVFVGNLVEWRDFESLLQATRVLLETVPMFELLVVGDGPARGSFEARAKALLPARTVRFAGEVPHTDVPFHIAASDFGLLPERVRSLDISPLKLFEYLSCGRPVVAFDVPGLDIVRTLGTGILVPPGDPGTLAAAMARLIGSPELVQEMGRTGRAFVERERSWSSVARKTSAYLAEKAARSS